MAESKTVIRGIVTGPRLGMKKVKKHQYLAKFESLSSKEDAARLLLERKAVCHLGKEKALRRIVGLHGNNGFVRIVFRKGLPEPSNGLVVLVF